MSPPIELSRRRFLGLGAAAGGLAVTGSLLPPSVHAAMARPARRGGLRAIEHVIVLMQENRSFDHYFGRLQGGRGFGDSTPLRRRGGGTVFDQPIASGGEVLPFSLRQAAIAAGRPVSDIQYLDDLPHGFVDATAAWADGWDDNWIAAKGQATMTFYERVDIPLQYELADTFTLCDAYHCSVNGSTNPNRNYLWSGTTGFEPATGLRAVTNAAYSYDHLGYDWTTFPERLEDAGVSWRIYQEWDNFTDNAVEYFTPFKRIGTKMLSAVTPRFRTTEELYDTVMFGGLPPAEQQRLLAELTAGRELLTEAEKRLFDLAMFRSEPESLVPRLRADIAAGTLPQVSLAGAVVGRLRAPRGVHAGRERQPHLRRPRRHRCGPGHLVDDRAVHQLRRERRLLRPRPAARRAAPGVGPRRRLVQRPADRARSTGADDDRVAVDRRRAGLLGGLRPHVRRAVPRALDRRRRAEHQSVAAAGVRRPRRRRSTSAGSARHDVCNTLVRYRRRSPGGIRRPRPTRRCPNRSPAAAALARSPTRPSSRTGSTAAVRCD